MRPRHHEAGSQSHTNERIAEMLRGTSTLSHSVTSPQIGLDLAGCFLTQAISCDHGLWHGDCMTTSTNIWQGGSVQPIPGAVKAGASLPGRGAPCIDRPGCREASCARVGARPLVCLAATIAGSVRARTWATVTGLNLLRSPRRLARQYPDQPRLHHISGRQAGRDRQQSFRPALDLREKPRALHGAWHRSARPNLDFLPISAVP